MQHPFKTILESINHEIKPIKNSRFMVNIIHIQNEKQAITQLNNIKEKYSDAGHHCWAYYLHENTKSRFNDDGEPNGSAGKPILAHLLGQGIFDVMIIVTRYFGGTKLGVGGLVRAYGGAASEALALAKFVTIIPKKTFWIQYDYESTSHINIVLHRFNVEPTQTQFDHNITIQIEVAYDQIEQLNIDITSATKGMVSLIETKPTQHI